MAVMRVGWGTWHYFLVFLCGLLSLAEASTSLTVPIVAPLIACDFKLSREQATIPVATSSFGILETSLPYIIEISRICQIDVIGNRN